MNKLYHYPICPLSRQVRICLRELDIPFTLVKEDYWQRRPEFLQLNPAGTLPVIEESTGLIIPGIYPIIEYLHEKYANFYFIDKDVEVRIETRRLLVWFNEKFDREVTKVLVDEKVVRVMAGQGAPRTNFIKAAKTNLSHHLNYINALLTKRSFIASETISAADIAAGSHLSIIDYFSEINWDNWPQIHHWYSILKSRPSFRPLLQDHIAGFTPPPSYANLDF